MSNGLVDYSTLVGELKAKRDAFAVEVEKLDTAIAAIEALA